MFVRVVTVATTVLVAWPALAEPLGVDAARRFVVGKTFAYNCFDGTRGAGRIQPTARSRAPSRFGGTGPVRFVQLPAGTLKVKGEAVCASVRGIPFEPCFNSTAPTSKASAARSPGLPFAYCDFTRRDRRPPSVARTAHRTSQPLVDPCGRRYPVGSADAVQSKLIRSPRRPASGAVAFRAGNKQPLVEPADADQHQAEADERQRAVDALHVRQVDEEHLDDGRG